MYIKTTIDIVKYTTNTSFSWYQYSLAVIRIAIYSFDILRTNKERILTIFYLVLIIATTCFYFSHISQPLHLPLPTISCQPPPSRHEILHRALLDGSFLGDQRIEGGDEGVGVGEDGGDGGLFGESGEFKFKFLHIRTVQMIYC